MAAVEKVVIAGVTFGVHGSGFADVLNSWVLWQGPDREGKNRKVSGGPVVAYPRRATETVRTLELLISGENDNDGDPYPDQRVGLEENIMFIRDTFADPIETGDGTVLLELYLPSGSVVSGPVTVEDLTFAGEGNFDVRATLDLSFPEGALVEGGS